MGRTHGQPPPSVDGQPDIEEPEVDVKIGVTYTPKEIEVELGDDADRDQDREGDRRSPRARAASSG